MMANEILETFRGAFQAADDIAAGRHGEEERCAETLRQLAKIEFPQKVLVGSGIGSRLGKLWMNHPSEAIKLASLQVLDAMIFKLYHGKSAAIKKPPVPVKAVEVRNKNRNTFDLFQKAVKASSSGEEERAVDCLKQLLKSQLPDDDKQLLSYMDMKLSKLEKHESPAVRELSTALLNAVRGRAPIRAPQVKRLPKSNQQPKILHCQIYSNKMVLTSSWFCLAHSGCSFPCPFKCFCFILVARHRSTLTTDKHVLGLASCSWLAFR